MTTRTKYTEKLLGPIIIESKSWAQVLRKLDLKQTGGNQVHIQSVVRHLGLDTSHFTGERWIKGLKAEDNPSVKAFAWSNRIPDENTFVENSRHVSGGELTKRLLKKDWKYVCSRCGINEWLDEPLTLHLDHINGIHNDNRYENLRFLCPNCHQQTDTWGNKKVVKLP